MANENSSKVKSGLYLFDFSSSPVGGGLKRLTEYIDILPSLLPDKDIWFLIHPRAVLPSRLKGYDKIIIAQSSRWKRLISESADARRFVRDKGQVEFYFAYGVPLLKRLGSLNWVHISNALTLSTANCTLTTKRKLEMWLLRRRFFRSKRVADVVSAESLFTLSLIRKPGDDKIRYILLPNGFDRNATENLAAKECEGRKFFLTIGTASYKRIWLVYEVAKMLADEMDIKSWDLVCIGTNAEVGNDLKAKPNIRFIESLAHEKVKGLLKQCSAYISASEIENSSNAALEAVLMAPTTVLSMIPSHLELFPPESLKPVPFKVGNWAFFRTNRCPIESLNTIKSWREIAHEMVQAIEAP